MNVTPSFGTAVLLSTLSAGSVFLYVDPNGTAAGVQLRMLTNHSAGHFVRLTDGAWGIMSTDQYVTPVAGTFTIG